MRELHGQRVNAPSDVRGFRDRSPGGGIISPGRTSHARPGTASEVEVPLATDVTSDLRASVHEVLRRAFRHARNDGATARMDEDTHDAMRSVCAMARATDVRAETLILAIKGGWRQLPEAQGATRMDAEIMLAALVTMCIKEYYAPQARL